MVGHPVAGTDFLFSSSFSLDSPHLGNFLSGITVHVELESRSMKQG